MWQRPSHPYAAVDIRVSPEDFIKLTKIFNRLKIRYKVQINDLQLLLNRQSDEQVESPSWHSYYHTLQQVNTSRYFLKLLGIHFMTNTEKKRIVKLKKKLLSCDKTPDFTMF